MPVIIRQTQPNVSKIRAGTQRVKTHGHTRGLNTRSGIGRSSGPMRVKERSISNDFDHNYYFYFTFPQSRQPFLVTTTFCE